MVEYNFSMSMSTARCKLLYEGSVQSIVVTSDTGRTVQIPAMRFRSFVTLAGIHGRFRLTLDDNNKFLALEKTY
ncbi:MAG: hypothetical protein ACI8WB_005657 [Phenylobacterium sp.]|jgi:hypothetical protein